MQAAFCNGEATGEMPDVMHICNGLWRGVAALCTESGLA